MQELRFSLRAWSAWAPGLESEDEWRAWLRGQRAMGKDGAPGVEFVPALQRRRLGRVARMVLQVAHEALSGAAADLPLVYASRHGETHRTLSLLEALAEGEAPSPKDFSLSVHNSVVGLYSIIHGNRSAHTALAAGSQTLFAALMEAACQLADGCPELLLLWTDEPPPAMYLEALGEVPNTALGLRLATAESGGVGFRLGWTRRTQVPDDEAAALRAVMRVILGEDGRSVWTGEQREWRLERISAGAA
jgi:hypothetical protein